jgi:multidrug resistance efflux pump
MIPQSFHDRGSLRFWVPLVLVMAAGIAGAGRMIRGIDSSNGQAQDYAAPSQPEPITVCLGVIDFEDGVLSLEPTVAGRVLEVPVKEDQQVKAGAVLMRLDDRAARDRVAEAEAALESAEVQLRETRKAPQRHALLLAQQRDAVEAAKHALLSAQLTASRKTELAKKELINGKESDAAQEEVKQLEAAEQADEAKLNALSLQDPAEEVRQAEAQVRSKQAAVDEARHQLAEYTLSAPVDGTVVRVRVNAGEVFGPQSKQAPLILAPAKPLIVRAEVDQEFMSRVAVGETAEFEDDTVAGGPVWRGRVVRIADWLAEGRKVIPDTPTFHDVRTLQCLIEPDAGRLPFRLGQRVRVRLYK